MGCIDIRIIRLILLVLMVNGSASIFAQNSTQIDFVFDYCQQKQLDPEMLLELEGIRSGEGSSSEMNAKKWQKKYGKWDPKDAMQDVNIGQLLLASYDIGVDDYFRRREYSGLPHSALQAALKEISVISEKHPYFMAFVQTALAVQPDTSAALVKDDLVKIHALIDDMQMNGLFSDEEFASIVSFYRSFEGLTPFEIDELPLDSFRMELFDAFITTKGMYPHSMFYVGGASERDLEYAISRQFVFGLLNGFQHIIRPGQGDRPDDIAMWPEEMSGYDNYMSDKRCRNMVIAQTILKKYSYFRGQQFLRQCASNNYSANVWNGFRKLDQRLEMATKLRLQFGGKQADNHVERLLLLAANGIYIMPSYLHSYGFDKTINTNVRIFYLDEKERKIIDGIEKSGLSFYAQELICGDSVLLKKLSESEHFRHALNVKYAQMALISKRNFYYESIDPYKLEREFSYIPTVSLEPKDRKERQRKIDEIVSQLNTILVENGCESWDYIVEYDGATIQVNHEINARASHAILLFLREICSIDHLELRLFRFYVPKDFIAFETESKMPENELKEPKSSMPPLQIVKVEENERESPKYAPPPPIAVPKNRIKGEIIDFPDIEASFPGGMSAFNSYLEENMQYPQASIEKQEQGKVYLSFIVEPDGSITGVKVERGVSPDLDREAKRLLRASPNWIPAEMDGAKVRAKCSYPVTFVLPN